MDQVNEVTKDCFNALIQIRSLGDDAHIAPEMFQSRIIGFIDDVFRKAQHANLNDRDTQDLAYAIVALADEIALRRPGGIRDVWMSNPLQLHYFNENLAGEGFFYRLEHVMADPSRLAVLRVYYQCLLFGFQGKYAVRGGELELTVVHRRVREALGKMMRPEPLARRHLRPRERITRKGQGFVTIWVGLFAVLFSLALIIVLRQALNTRTEQLVERITTLLAY